MLHFWEEILGKSIRGKGVQEVVGLGPGRTQVWWNNFVNDAKNGRRVGKENF